MTDYSYAFVSYQTDDRYVAGGLREILDTVGIKSFLAHEDIEVSEEWCAKILEELAVADIFICLLSKSYLKSQWCIQESGIAAFRKDMAIIPLSLDGTIPQGFLRGLQSGKIDPDRLSIRDLIPGFLKHDYSKGLSLVIDLIASSGNYRGAEANFELILPHLSKLTPEQGKTLLEHCVRNNQVYDAGRCAKSYIPKVLKLYGGTISERDREFLEKACRHYGANI